MAYATAADVEARTTRTFAEDELTMLEALLEDAAVMIDAARPGASAEAKKVVSCRMVLRAMGDGGETGIPIGATQGTVTAGPYSQTWTVGAGSAGELYLGKGDRALLGAGDRMGAASPLETLVPEEAVL
jgi:hypothetical protein